MSIPSIDAEDLSTVHYCSVDIPLPTPYTFVLGGFFMTVQDHLRQMLETNKNIFLSGGEIAASLGVSRNAVWKAVKSLQADGYPIEAVPNRGYRLLPSSDVLSESGVRQYLTGEAKNLDIHVFDTLESTNLTLRELANAGAPEGTVVLAAAQTGGRGRKGRSFYSPAGTGVYVSILLRPDLAAEDAVRITTAAAVAVCEAVESVSGRAAAIKWVNDVLMDGKKVCGILTEASFGMESGRIDYAVLGAGINVYAPDGGFPAEIAKVAGSVLEHSLPDAKNRLAAAYLSSLLPLYLALGSAEAIAAYRRRSLAIGRTVTVLSGTGARSARALDVDERCRLLVEYEDGACAALSSGEISIKL